jgi:hypothetical protein
VLSAMRHAVPSLAAPQRSYTRATPPAGTQRRVWRALVHTSSRYTPLGATPLIFGISAQAARDLHHLPVRLLRLLRLRRQGLPSTVVRPKRTASDACRRHSSCIAVS